VEISESEEVECPFCHQKHFIRQYVGFGDKWWTDHMCEGYMEDLTDEEKEAKATDIPHCPTCTCPATK